MMYEQHGVSHHKADVHHAIANINKGLYPTAFCKVVPDLLSNEGDYCCVMHADGAGTKSLIAYMYWKETGDINVFKGVSQDALAMNIDDILCVGATGPVLVSTTIGRHAKLIPREVLKVLIESFEDLMTRFTKLGLSVYTTGGETADLGDLVRTLVVDATVISRVKRSNIIDMTKIRGGDIIIGLASYGQTAYESKYNSGIGSNGLTLARHSLLDKSYAAKYPETYDVTRDDISTLYKGSLKFTDQLEGTPLTVGEALLSPTRSYTPIITQLLQDAPHLVHGIIHCSGGGQTKCKNFVKGLKFVKDDLFPCPPIFKIIQKEGGIEWREMYQVFNMGHRMEIIGPANLLPIVSSICNDYNLECKRVGYVEASVNRGMGEVVIKTPEGTFTY